MECSVVRYINNSERNPATLTDITSTVSSTYFFLFDSVRNSTSEDNDVLLHDPSEETFHAAMFVENVIYTKVILIVCVCGLIGNTLNLVVLSQKSLTYAMERMEKSAHYGLVGLAIADMLFCFTTLPNAFIGTGSFSYRQYDFRILYAAYNNGVINTFILTSTWLTVVMASSRYIAVCYPLRARQFIGKRFAIWSLAIVFITSAVFNIPRYFKYEINSIDCLEGGQLFYLYPGLLPFNVLFDKIYQWIYFILGIVLPVMLLIYCNVHLMLALRKSLRMYEKTRVSRHDSQAASRITLTLIIIILMYILLFIPAEILNFFKDFAVQNRNITPIYNLITAILNLLQAINFAFNFALYCAVNTHFRKTFIRLMSCSRRRSGKERLKYAGMSLNRRYCYMTECTTVVL